MGWAVLNWLEAGPWRPGLVMAAAAWTAVLSPLVGGIAWLVMTPAPMFVVGYGSWFVFRGWKGVANLVVFIGWTIAAWVVFGSGFGDLTSTLYTVAGIATTAAFAGGYLWGRHRENQERLRVSPPDAPGGSASR